MNTYIFSFNVVGYYNETVFQSSHTREFIIFRLLANGLNLDTLTNPLERTYILRSNETLEFWINVIVREMQPEIENHAEAFYFHISKVAIDGGNIMMMQNGNNNLQENFVALATQVGTEKLGW